MYLTMTDASGAVSDWVLFANTGPNGNGEVLFFSDPNAPVPEPATMSLVGAGLIATWFVTRRRKRSA